MAELRKITKSPGISNFSQVGPEGGSAFLAFADMAKQAYNWMKPAAMEQMAREGQEEGAELARRQIGQNSFPIVPRSVPAPAGGDLSGFSPDGAEGGNFPASLIRTESGGNWGALNKEGYGGRLQFGKSRLADAARAGIIPAGMTGAEFSKLSPAEQQKVENWHFSDIDQQAARRGLNSFIGSTINGIPITQNGIRAMAHLGGIGGAEKFLKSGGKINPADSNGTSLADYARTHAGVQTAAAAGVSPDQPRMAFAPEESALQAIAPEAAPTLVRTAEGKIEPRTFSPLSGEILQAHRAAQSTAYLSEMLVKGSGDLMGLSENFIGNPSGFEQAVNSYIDEVVKDAPEMMKGDLRQKLSQEGQRRFLGMVEEQQRDIRQRANNSSRALVERYSNDYAEALAAGNFEEAASLRGQLNDVLIARESLPGVAWTREQSENAVLQAQDAATRIAEQNQNKVRSSQAGTLRTIIKAAENGQAAADESILDDPNVSLLNPELASEAAAKVALRDMMPGFFALSPGDMDAMIAEERARPVEEGWQIDIPNAMVTARNAAVKELQDDPIAYAQNRLPIKPPALDDFSPDDPEGFVSSLAARKDYANGMVAGGYVNKPAFLSKPEIESLSAVLGKDSPPEIRTAVAGAIVSGFGTDAQQVFKTLKVDGVTAWGGTLMAKGGSASLATEAARGQQMIDEKIAQLPPEKDWKETFQGTYRQALAGLPADAVKLEADIIKVAKAIYANRASAPGFEADEGAMNEAINAALGQTTRPNGDVVGGIQTVFGNQTMMPLDMNAEEIQEKLKAGFYAPDSDGLNKFGMIWGTPSADANMDFWADLSVQEQADGSFISGGVPRVGGEFLPASLMLNGDLKFIPVDGTRYRMQVDRSNATLDVHDNDGNIFIIDMARLK